MEPNKQLIVDPTQYGSRGQSWAPEFVAYMVEIVTHPNYREMPDAIKDDGKIQWEAPSNRSSGKYQFTHDKRRDWWARKAKEIGIDTTADQWISRTAKMIHPNGEKPCKRCGRIMQISYSYPQKNLIKRFVKIFGDDFEISEVDPINDILQRAYDIYGQILFKEIKTLLVTKHITVPDFEDIDTLLEWVSTEYIPREPSMLSPGAMSNAPDRLDGFHSFNRCCRGKADTGRHASNLRSYTTDRRVFEFWSEGDWIAADRLMGLVRSALRNEECADGGDGPPTADHIGPLSLGFCHRPEFKLLSKAANSAKNNRMSLWDVNYLIECEREGVKVVSWYAKPIWDLCKANVDNEEKALRLSKIMRDNQRNAMWILCQLFDAGKFAFLTYLLELSYADRNVKFENLTSKNFITNYSNIIEKKRTTKYSSEQKARRLRIGFDSLRTYNKKNNRHSFIIEEEAVNTIINNAIFTLGDSFDDVDRKIHSILYPDNSIISDSSLREFVNNFPVYKIDIFEEVKDILSSAMNHIAKHLSTMWDHPRYVREEFDLR